MCRAVQEGKLFERRASLVCRASFFLRQGGCSVVFLVQMFKALIFSLVTFFCIKAKESDSDELGIVLLVL